MDVRFTFETEDAVQKAVAFKSFIEEERLIGVESIEVEQKKGQPGDQGIGLFIGSLFARLSGNSETIKGLISLVSRFMELFDGRLIMEDGNGKKLTIPGGRKLTPEQKENIALHFNQLN